MSIEAGMIERYGTVFNGRLWWDRTPAGMSAAQRVEPFAIMQIVGGTNRRYVDQSLGEWINARVQFFVWGRRSIAVGDAMRALHAAILASNTPDWVAEPMGDPVGDGNETLDLVGLRADFSITYRNPLYQG